MEKHDRYLLQKIQKELQEAPAEIAGAIQAASKFVPRGSVQSNSKQSSTA